MKCLSDQEKKKLREEAAKELNRLEKIYTDSKTTEKINAYKNYFNLCESTYKVVLKAHQLTTKGRIDGYLKLDMRQAPYAMTFAGYNVNRNLLERLFGRKPKNRKRSAKVLRDLVTHGIDEGAVEEIIKREKTLYKDMNTFLQLIRNK